MTVEANPLALEELALYVGPEAVPMAAPAGRVDDALPGHEVEQRTAQRAQRHAHRPRAARLPEDGGDLPVRDHPAARDATDDPIDQTVEGRRTGGALAPLPPTDGDVARSHGPLL